MTFDEGHYLLGIAGLALLRAGADRRLAGVDDRVAEIRSIAAAIDQPPYSSCRELPEQDVASGYRAGRRATTTRATTRSSWRSRPSREGASQRAKAGHLEASEQALTGVPAVLIWEAERSHAAV